MKENKNNLIRLHLVVFLFGFAALFGKVLNLSPFTIVFGRTLFAAITLFFILLFSKQSFKLNSTKDCLFLAFVGIIYAIHWITFFQSIQMSSIAIAVLTFSTFPIFVTFLEPYFFNEKIKTFDIVIALVTLFGVSQVIPKFELSNNLTQGALWGIASGFTCAILAIACRKNVQKYSSTLISFYQNLTCAVILLPTMIYLKPTLCFNDILLLVLLGVMFTAFTNTLFIGSLRTIKTQLASIVTSLEPVYSIVFAAILLNEIPPIKTIFGGLIILGAIICATVKSKPQQIVLEH